MVIFEFDKLEKDKIRIVLIFFKYQKGEKRAGRPVAKNGEFMRENDLLLSRIPANSTVRIRRSEKESCSTRRGLRVDSGFESF